MKQVATSEKEAAAIEGSSTTSVKDVELGEKKAGAGDANAKKNGAAAETEGEEEDKKENTLATKGMTFWELMFVLKPFFWPNEGTEGMFVNRVRASSTWFSVLSGRICSIYAPFFIQDATNSLVAGDYDDAVINILSYVMLRIGASGFKELQGALYVGVKQQGSIQLTLDTFIHIHSLSLSWHLNKKTGGVMKSLDRGVAAVNQLVMWLFLYLIPAMAEALAVIVLFFVSFNQWEVAVTILGGVVLYFYVTIRITIWRKKFREKQNKYDNDFHDKAQDSIVNFETVKYFTAEKYEANRYLESVTKYEKNVSNTMNSMQLLNFVQQLILNATMLGALILCAGAVYRDEMSLGGWVAVMAWIIQIFQPLNFLGSIYSGIVQALIDVRNLTELLNEEPDIVDKPDATDIPFFASQMRARLSNSVKAGRSSSVGSNSDNMESEKEKALDNRDLSMGVGVEFKDVDFHYPSQPEEKGLKKVSFTMPAGSTTAIVGGTGAGKTTLSRLLFRFYDPKDGLVLIDGQDVTKSTQKSVRGMIGIVPQDTVLFNDTIRYNIRYGRQDATEEEIRQAAESAQILDFIESMPEGFDTVVGERGLKLSGGEKQRVAIARCLLKNPPIVVLDEATSALDTVTENSVQEALDTLGTNRTVLIIAHRLSTIKHADQIVAMDNGRVAEVGSHEELCGKVDGIYAKLWSMQQRSNASSDNLVAQVEVLGEEVLQAEPI